MFLQGEHLMKVRISRVYSILLIIVILLIAITTVYSLSSETRSALKGSVQERLISTASIAASEIDGDSFANLGKGDENTVAFTRIRDQIRRIKDASNHVRFIYTMRKSGDSVEFVVDGDYGYSSDAGAIGDDYPQAESRLLAGFSEPSADDEFTTDKWGTVLSGYAPIRDSRGRVVGIVGVDMDSSDVTAELDRINLILYLIGIIAMGGLAVGIIVVERRRASDEQKLEDSEKRYRLLFELARDCILLIEAEGENKGKIIAANAAAAKMHGYSIEEMITKNIADLDTRESAELVPDRFRHILDGKHLVSEAMHVRKDGTVFPVEINAGLVDFGTKRYILAIDRDVTDRKNAEKALQQVSKKLALLNSVTFNEIQNSIFALNGYLALERIAKEDYCVENYLDLEEELVRKVNETLNFAKNYQDLGVQPPLWQNVEQSFLLGISHLDYSSLRRTIQLDNLEIYADSLLERVFFTMTDNILHHAKTATEMNIRYRLNGDSLVLFLEDDGNGIPYAIKEKVFERGFGTQKGMELFLVREILSITGITIQETGAMGKGARFEMTVPKGAFRFPGNK
jgi:PAS domain S-box-containing protein